MRKFTSGTIAKKEVKNGLFFKMVFFFSLFTHLLSNIIFHILESMGAILKKFK